MDVHIYGPSIATVVGTSTEKRTHKDGNTYSQSYAWVDTWMERNGKWECIGEGLILVSARRWRREKPPRISESGPVASTLAKLWRI